MEKAIKNCDTIICASKAAKNEISQIFKIEKKVKFIYLNINEEFFKKRNNFYLEKINYQHKYLLTITSCAKYHNILKYIFNRFRGRFAIPCLKLELSRSLKNTAAVSRGCGTL